MDIWWIKGIRLRLLLKMWFNPARCAETKLPINVQHPTPQSRQSVSFSLIAKWRDLCSGDHPKVMASDEQAERKKSISNL
jgi:hypothetical protein